MSTCRFSLRLAPVLAIAVLWGAPSIGADRTGPYVGGGIGGGSTDFANAEDGIGQCYYGYYNYFDCDIDEDILILDVHGGYRLNPYFAVEGKILGAANDGEYDGDEVTFGALSARAVGLIPITDVVELFALVGLYIGEAEVGYYDSDDDSGVVYGGGVQLNFGGNGQFTVRLEYEVYETDDLLDDVQGFTAGFQYNFFQF